MPAYIYGFHSIEEMLKNPHIRGTLLVAQIKPRYKYLLELAQSRGVQVNRVTIQELDNICARNKNRGIVLAIEKMPKSMNNNLNLLLKRLEQDNPLVVLLDGITDPHNLGAILRSCDQFRVDNLVLPTRKAAHITGVVHKVSSGATAFVPVTVVSNLMQAINILRKNDYWIYGADLNGENINIVDLKGRIALVMGGEGKGLRPIIKQACDRLIRIPGQGHIDSFNVSVAAGIILYEIRRQQGFTYI
jgi:23S rRNA (guanosine2251-2'-O)-methyltransferase